MSELSLVNRLATGLLTLCFIAVVSAIYLNPAEGRRVSHSRVTESRNLNVEQTAVQLDNESSAQSTASEDEITIWMMTQSLRGLNPDVYSRVDVEVGLKNIQLVDDQAMDLESVKVINIYVYSGQWDVMRSQKRFDLLDSTFDLLNQNFPIVTPFVNLKFDDNRQDLRLKDVRRKIALELAS